MLLTEITQNRQSIQLEILSLDARNRPSKH